MAEQKVQLLAGLEGLQFLNKKKSNTFQYPTFLLLPAFQFFVTLYKNHKVLCMAINQKQWQSSINALTI